MIPGVILAVLNLPGTAILQFGDRRGSYIALTIFGVLFAVLGAGVWREIRRRMPERPRLAWTAGTVLLAGPVVVIYVSSLAGFYEAEVRNRQLVLRYLHGLETHIAFGDIEAVRAAPAFKGRWRLHVQRTGTGEYASAAGSRDQINDAAEILRSATPKLR